MSEKKSSGAYALKRLPPSYRGIQVNYCKSPVCKNFGIPAKQGSRGRGGVAKDRDPNYTVSGAGKATDFVTTFKCKSCSEHLPIKSNRGISLEYKRLSDYLKESDPACTNNQCRNHRHGLKKHPDEYHRFGKTRHGSSRYRCKSCKTTFSIGKSTLRHKKPHLNVQIFSLLINKMPLNRIMEVADVTAATLYGKIDFIHRQCIAFIANRERKMIGSSFTDRLYLSTDRQMYYLNWTKRKDKRTVNFEAVGTADNRSSYVFGMHLNFDPGLNADRIEHWAIKCNDYERPMAMRRHAHIWLLDDYHRTAEHKARKSARKHSQSIQERYDEAAERDDIESSRFMDPDVQLPTKGVQIHNEYTLYAHFFLMAEMFKGVEKVRFYMDMESGIRAAFMTAFNKRVLNRTADAWYVMTNKELTTPEKNQLCNKSELKIKAVRRSFPSFTEYDAKMHLLKSAMGDIKHIGPWKDRWLDFPFATMSEAEKQVCWLTDLGDYTEDHQAALYGKASLHAIDRFFMQTRRRFTYLERPIATPSQNRRTWYGYTAYDPNRIQQVLDIYRTAYNYHWLGDDKHTPAMRLGLSKGKVSLEDIIYFS